MRRLRGKDRIFLNFNGFCLLMCRLLPKKFTFLGRRFLIFGRLVTQRFGLVVLIEFPSLWIMFSRVSTLISWTWWLFDLSMDCNAFFSPFIAGLGWSQWTNDVAEMYESMINQSKSYSNTSKPYQLQSPAARQAKILSSFPHENFETSNMNLFVKCSTYLYNLIQHSLVMVS